MVNRRFWLVIALVLGIMAAGCKTDEDYELPAAGGKLTINGIPDEYNGKYIFFSGPAGIAHVVVCGFIDMSNPGKGGSERIKLATIFNGTAVMSLYIIDQEAESFSDYIEAYDWDVLDGDIYIIDNDAVDSNGFLTWEELVAVRASSIMKPISGGESSDANFTVDWSTGEGEEE